MKSAKKLIEAVLSGKSPKQALKEGLNESLQLDMKREVKEICNALLGSAHRSPKKPIKFLIDGSKQGHLTMIPTGEPDGSVEYEVKNPRFGTDRAHSYNIDTHLSDLLNAGSKIEILDIHPSVNLKGNECKGYMFDYSGSLRGI